MAPVQTLISSEVKTLKRKWGFTVERVREGDMRYMKRERESSMYVSSSHTHREREIHTHPHIHVPLFFYSDERSYRKLCVILLCIIRDLQKNSVIDFVLYGSFFLS